MDSDGMTLIHGLSGAPVANKFFSSSLSHRVTGGARSRSASWVAESIPCVVIVISEDSKGSVLVHFSDGTGEPTTISVVGHQTDWETILLGG